MRYLLDTHTFIWAALKPDKLSKAALEAIKKSNSELLLSVASLWEIGILLSLKRMEFDGSIEEMADLSVSELGTQLKPIEPKQIDRMLSLPFHHRDPFDRLLIAQALDLKATILGKDELFDRYGCRRTW